ncbi:MAG: FAD-dependent oxidoreductase [Cyanobacteria bacterium P01_D01_bin.73]
MEDLSTVPSGCSDSSSTPIVVIGAGLAGLVAAKSLQRRGYRVLVLEKSLGTGGRLNSRRIDGVRADRGVRYLDGSLPLTAELIQPLVEQGLVQRWAGTGFQYSQSKLDAVATHDRYCAPEGISQVAKALAQGVDVRFNHRAIALTPHFSDLEANPSEQLWTVYCDHPRSEPLRGEPKPLQDEISAATLIVTIPAPQAEGLLATLDAGRYQKALDLLQIVSPVRYNPCFTVTATYAPARDLDPPALRNWQGIELLNDSALAWIAREDRKSSGSDRPVVGLQSSAEFAERWVDSQDLYPIGRQLLAQAEQIFNLPFRHPQAFQVHCWRYAQAINPLAQPYLHDESSNLWIGGDWCGGNDVEGALASGLAIADAVDQAHGTNGINPSLADLVSPFAKAAAS